jgi:hypothetical protein
MANMFSPLTKEGIIELVNEIIKYTSDSMSLLVFKAKRKLVNENIVSEGCYRGFH